MTAAAPAPPGADPGTDLRGTGMLGLMQMLFFLLDTQTLPLAHDIFKLSQHETQARPPRAGSTPFWGKRSAKTSYSELRLDFYFAQRFQVLDLFRELDFFSHLGAD